MKTNRILRIVALSGLFLTILIPFVVASNFYFPFITGKAFAFRIIVEVAAAAWLALAFRDPEYRPRRTWLLWAFAAWVGIMAVADAFGVNPLRSFWSNFERMEGWITLAHLLLYFVTASCMLAEEGLWDIFWNSSIVASVGMCLFGIAQLLGWTAINQGGVRVDGRFGNATYFATYLLFHIFISLIYLYRSYLKRGADWIFYSYIVAILLQLALLYYTATRGDILGLFVGLIVMAGLLAWEQRGNALVKKVSLGFIAACVVFGGLFWAVRKTSFVQKSPVLSRFASISLSDTTTESRFLIWGMAIKGFKDRPILGYGQENFGIVFNKYFAPAMYGQEVWFDRTHDIVFDWLVSGGILGLASYLALFAAGVLALRKAKHFSVTERALLVGLLAAYFFQNLFVFDNLTSYILFVLVLAWFQAGSDAPYLGGGKAIAEGVDDVLLVVVVIACGVSVYFLNVPAMYSAYSLDNGVGWASTVQYYLDKSDTASAAEAVRRSLTSFQETLADHPLGIDEGTERLSITAAQIAKLAPASNPDPIYSQFADYATTTVSSYAAIHPEDARIQFFYGAMLAELGNRKDAIPVLEKTLAISPNRQYFLFYLAQTELAIAGTDPSMLAQGLAHAKQAFDADPSIGESRISYAMVLFYAKKPADAAALLAPCGDGCFSDPRIVRALIDTKQYDLLTGVLEKKVAADASDIESRVKLGVLYAMLGEKDKAIATLSETLKLNPDPTFQAEVQSYIASIKAGKVQVQ